MARPLPPIQNHDIAQSAAAGAIAFEKEKKKSPEL